MVRIGDHLSDIVRLASLASVEPRTGRGSGRSVPSSRPPLNVDGLDPALTLVWVGGATSTVLEILEGWTKLVLEAREMAPYGPWSALAAINARKSPTDTTATLTGCTGFLRASLPWWEADPEQPIDDFAAEIHACRRAMGKYDPDREPIGYAAYCPTDGCGARLRYQHADEEVRCPRCQVVRDVPTLVAVVMSDPDCRDIWADVETAALHYGVSVSTIKRMVGKGQIERKRGRYLISRREAMA
jgi:hypothetical protein